jgi:hypothetical protein
MIITESMAMSQAVPAVQDRDCRDRDRDWGNDNIVDHFNLGGVGVFPQLRTNARKTFTEKFEFRSVYRKWTALPSALVPLGQPA